MKTLVESINASINEAQGKFEVVFLMGDPNDMTKFDEGEIEADEVEQNMYENDKIKHLTISASSDKDAIKKAQKELDKYEDFEECLAATIYNGPADDGDTVETIFSKAWTDAKNK